MLVFLQIIQTLKVMESTKYLLIAVTSLVLFLCVLEVSAKKSNPGRFTSRYCVMGINEKNNLMS